MCEIAERPSSRAYPVTAAGAVLLVDDEPDIVEVMAAWTEADGCQALRAASARAALDVACAHSIAVAVCDVQMPEHDGFWLVEHLRARHPSIAVILVTGVPDVEWALRGLQVGAVDYLLKPFDQRTFSRALETALRQHRIRADAEALRDARAVELAARHQRLTNALGRLGIRTTAHVRAALDLVACRQDQWREHSLRVAALARRLATALQMTGEQVEHLEQGALLHEVGRLVLPDTLLTRTGELSAEDRALWRRVPTLAASVLDAVPSLTGPASIIRARFEEYAGGGYPRQLAGEQIPLGSRVLAVTDSYDAMRSPRPFRDAFTHDQAAAELTRGAGTQFDPDVVRRFLRLSDVG